MISKNTVKLIHSLSQKKYRKKENLFLVEGDKNVLDTLRSKIKVSHLFATQTFLSENKPGVNNAAEITEADSTEIKKASLQKKPQNCIALCEIPDPNKFPGNLGTILRICDWFGIEYIFCSPDTADIYNPKVVQASMGSICRTNVIYAGFENVAGLARVSKAKITGAFLDGENIFTGNIPAKAILVVGNEGNGIRKKVENGIDKKIMIPHFTNEGNKAESLNVAVATGIICAEFKRQHSSF